MTEINNNIDVRANNARKIIMALRNSPPITKKALADELGLSLPTITNIAKILLKHEYIAECGSVSSYVGRKPALISLNKGARLNVGVSVSTHTVSVAIVDFGGDILYRHHKAYPYTGTKAYWTKLSGYIDSVLEESKVDTAKIVGIRIAMPAVFDPEYWALAGMQSRPRGMVPQKEIPSFFSCKADVITTAEAAGVPRLWYGSVDSDSVVIFLSRYIEGCVMSRDPNTKAINTRVCQLGHMSLNAEGPKCFCGKRGCFQAYCSTSIIVDKANGLDTSKTITANETDRPPVHLDAFFAGLDEGNEQYRVIWDEYLDKLAYAIHNLRLLFGSEIIICGEISQFVARYKKTLVEKIDAISIIKDDVDEYLHTSSLDKYDACVGAALSLCDSGLISIFR